MKIFRFINRDVITLFLILCIGTFLRFYQLNSIPPSPSLDEATIGWNAYSILVTGMDEYGNKFPLILRAYDDWRPALYVYLVIPFVKIFGLSVLSVRIPSVILSLMVIIMSFLIGKDVYIYPDKKNPNRAKFVGFLSASFVTLSPWQIYLSRLGHEANLGLFFTVLGTYLFLQGIRNKSFFTFIFSNIVFILAMYSYQSQKIIIPVTLLLIVVIFYREIFKFGKKIVFIPVIMFVPIIPMLISSFSQNGLIRLEGTSAFNQDQTVYQDAKKQYLKAIADHNFLERLTYSKKMIDLKIFTSNYFSHFNPTWLFWGGAKEPHKVPYMGLLYIWEIPLMVVGLIYLFKSYKNKISQLILGIFFTSPLAAAITTQAPHAMRSYTFIPIIQIISAIGLIQIYALIKTKYVKYIFTILFCVLAFNGMRQLWNGYFIIFPELHSSSFQYSIGPTIKYVNTNLSKYQKIVFSNRDNLYQSYMFYLFYSQYYPLKYLSYGGTISGGYAQNHQFDKFEFRYVDLTNEKSDKNTLYILNNSETNGRLTIEQVFLNPDGSRMILAGSKNQ